MTVTLYTTSTCPYCKQEEEYLTNKKVDFVKVVLDQQPEKLEEFRQVSPDFSGVPLTVIVKDDGEAVAVRGFNVAELEGVLSQAQEQTKVQETTETPTVEANDQSESPESTSKLDSQRKEESRPDNEVVSKG